MIRQLSCLIVLLAVVGCESGPLPVGSDSRGDVQSRGRYDPTTGRYDTTGETRAARSTLNGYRRADTLTRDDDGRATHLSTGIRSGD